MLHERHSIEGPRLPSHVREALARRPDLLEVVSGLSNLELLRVQRPPVCEEMTGASWDSLRRTYPHLVIKISERIRGISLLNLILIAGGLAQHQTADEQIEA
jgi:hypothetical protein